MWSIHLKWPRHAHKFVFLIQIQIMASWAFVNSSQTLPELIDHFIENPTTANIRMIIELYERGLTPNRQTPWQS